MRLTQLVAVSIRETFWGALPSARDLVRSIATVLLVLLPFQACTHWVQQSQPVPNLLAAKPDSKLRVTLVTGRVVELSSPRIIGDSLVGVIPWQPAEPEAVALADIRASDVRRVDAPATTSLIVLGSVAFLYLLARIVYPGRAC